MQTMLSSSLATASEQGAYNTSREQATFNTANDHTLDMDLLPPYVNISLGKMCLPWASLLNKIWQSITCHGRRPSFFKDCVMHHNLDYEYGYHGSNDHRAKINIRSWKSTFSLIMIQLLVTFQGPLAALGRFVEWFLNFIAFNSTTPLKDIIIDILLLRFDRIIWHPPRDSPKYYSFIGWLDPRQELMKESTNQTEKLAWEEHATNSRRFVDLAIMASKLAYESQHVQRDVVNNVWEMNFMKSYTFWNDHLHAYTTNAFVFTDKPTDANVIFLAFRGTEPFNAMDWATDVDLSFVQLGVGRVHVGFLEALGLVNREHPTTFAHFKRNCEDINYESNCAAGVLRTDENETKDLAFDVLNKEIWRVMSDNPKAKLFVCGHSLGGALALLFAGILMYKRRGEEEDMILKKLSSIYTFGQPRICDGAFSDYLVQSLDEWKIDFYRIVYSNDVVSRILFDDPIFNFKHVACMCYYYNSCFLEKNLVSEPNENFFSLWYVVPMWVNAIWELLRGVMLGRWLYGKEYKEGILTIFVRVVGLVLPGISAHLPVNYVDAIRLGPAILVRNNINQPK